MGLDFLVAINLDEAVSIELDVDDSSDVGWVRHRSHNGFLTALRFISFR